MRRDVWAMLLLLAAMPAAAQYSDECRDLARRLAVTPGALSMGELDLVKDCVAGLQRAIALGEKVANGDPLPCAPAVPPPAAAEPAPCPACPAVVAPVCPKAAPAAPAARERPEDRRLKPYLPRY